LGPPVGGPRWGGMGGGGESQKNRTNQGVCIIYKCLFLFCLTQAQGNPKLQGHSRMQTHAIMHSNSSKGLNSFSSKCWPISSAGRCLSDHLIRSLAKHQRQPDDVGPNLRIPLIPHSPGSLMKGEASAVGSKEKGKGAVLKQLPL